MTLKQIRFGTTQKSEAVDRGISKSVPKNVTFKHSFAGRVHSVIHRINHGIGESTIFKCEALGAQSSRGSRALKFEQDRQKYHKVRSDSTKQKI